MGSLKDRLQADLVAALKSQETRRRDVIRAVLTAIRNAEIEQGKELDEPGISKVLQKQLKQRKESQAAFAGRPEMAAAEEAEALIIAEYLPPALSEEELGDIIKQAVVDCDATSLRDMGRVMAAVNTKVQGRADGSAVAALVKARLS